MTENSIKPGRDIDILLTIMAALRDKQTGCPWDIEQDFQSILPYTIEEVYEVADAILRDDMQDLQLELGDLLLQVVYYAQMAREEGQFDFGDVVNAITTKMIRRHPHVFGTEEQRRQGLQKDQWAQIKAQEKAEQAQLKQAAGQTMPHKGLLSDVPAAFPPLKKAHHLQAKAAKVGFDWGAPELVLDKIDEELQELKQGIENRDQANIKEELGDLLFVMVNLARQLDVDAEMALEDANRKFLYRFNYIEDSLEQQGRSLQEASLDEMEELWTQAKIAKRAQQNDAS